MRQNRTLQLRKEALVDLSPDELMGIGAGAPEGRTQGRVCAGIVVVLFILGAGGPLTTIC